MTTAPHSQRFDLLDGLRGIAALAVMLYHYTQHNGLDWLQGAWVAVDLFFVLSGFVIAHSYGRRIAEGGMGFREFLAVRLIRLGPLYLLGLALGTLAALILVIRGTLDGDAVLKAFLLNLAWLPDVNSSTWPFGADRIPGPIFPLNDPAWTLFYELFVNLLFFFFVRHFRKVSALWFVGLAAAVYLYFTFAQGRIHPGWGSRNWLYGFPRVTAEFFAGALIFSAGLHLRKMPQALAWVVAAVALWRFGDWEYSLLSSLTLIPLTILLASSVQLRDATARRVCKVLGELSYPLYILHFPLHRLISETTGIGSSGPVAQTLLIAAISVAVALALAPLDMGLRKSLSGRFLSKLQARPMLRSPA